MNPLDCQPWSLLRLNSKMRPGLRRKPHRMAGLNSAVVTHPISNLTLEQLDSRDTNVAP